MVLHEDQQGPLADLVPHQFHSHMPAMSTGSGLAETHDVDNHSSSGPSTKVGNALVKSTYSFSTIRVSLLLAVSSNEAGCLLLSRRMVCRAVVVAWTGRLPLRALFPILLFPARSIGIYRRRALQISGLDCTTYSPITKMFLLRNLGFDQRDRVGHESMRK